MPHLAATIIIEEHAAVAADRDPMAGGTRDRHYDRLFTRIVLTAPAPIGVGPSAESRRS